MRLIHRPPPASHQWSKCPVGFLNQLGGSLTAMVTPLRRGQLDTAALASMCERQVKRGTSALVVCGSTGEAPALLASEQGSVIRAAVEAADNRAPIIAGCGGPATDAAIAAAVAASRHGASALLCAPPPYSKPTPEGVIAHIRAVAHAADLPVILYDVPSRTGIAVADETVARLFESGLIVAIKDASGDLGRPARLRALCGGELVQFSGDDATATAHRAMGGDGCISVTANVAPVLCARLHRAWDGGDLDEVGRVRDLLAPLHDALFVESNPIPVKAALGMAGLCESDVRLPLTRATQATTDRLAQILPDILTAEEASAGLPSLSLVV